MSRLMPAVVNFGPSRGSVELREIPIPEIGSRDVLLKVEAVSVCGSDLHQWMGSHGWNVNYPCVLGHEFCGTIAQAGGQVTGFAEGDRVVSETAAVIDERSPMSRRGLYNLDPNRLGFGYGVDGAMTQFVKVPDRCLHAIPPKLPFEQAALTEPCSVAYNAVCVHGRIRPGDDVLVLGPGPIGLLCGMMAGLCGAGRWLIAGLPADAKRLAVAAELGGAPVPLAEAVDRVRGHGDGLGADVVIDATGVSASLRTAIEAVRPAGQIIKVGWGPQPLDFSLDGLVQKAVELHGSFSHNWPVWERVISMLASGQLAVDRVVNRVGVLSEWRDCFEQMHAGACVKAVLRPNQGALERR